MLSTAPSPYYLSNFERALAWIAERYDDLLDMGERDFLHDFAGLPLQSRALLVRMLMRQGPLFRASRLVYEEIGCPLAAAAPLAALGWVDTDAPVTIDELFSLATRPQAALPASAWWGFAYVAVFSMWIGFFAWYRGLALGGTVRVSQVQLVQPFLSMLFAVPLLGERLDALTLTFAVAVIATVFIGKKMPVRVARA